MSETSDGKSLRDRGVELSAATRSEAKRWAEELNERFDQLQETLRTDIERIEAKLAQLTSRVPRATASKADAEKALTAQVAAVKRATRNVVAKVTPLVGADDAPAKDAAVADATGRDEGCPARQGRRQGRREEEDRCQQGRRQEGAGEEGAGEEGRCQEGRREEGRREEGRREEGRGEEGRREEGRREEGRCQEGPGREAVAFERFAAASAVRRRLDAELVRRKLVPSRASAVEAIAAGRVPVGGAPARPRRRQVAPDEPIEVDGPRPRS